MLCYFLIECVLGGKVVHSYGRLILNEAVISDRQQLQPPNNVSGNGRIECRVINGEAKFNYFGYDVSTDTSKDVYRTGDDGESNAVVIKQKARNFAMEGKCAGLFHYLFLKNGERCITLKVYAISPLILYYHALCTKLAVSTDMYS